MANRPKGFGLSKEVADRMDAKYSDEDEQEVTAWITAITGLAPEGCGRDVSLLYFCTDRQTVRLL